MTETTDFPAFDPADHLMRLPSGDWVNPRDITKIGVETDGSRFSSFSSNKPFRPFVRINLGDNYVSLVHHDSADYVRRFADYLGATVNQAKRYVPPAPGDGPDPVAAPPAPPPPSKAQTLKDRG